MLWCEKCQKEIVLYGVSHGAQSEGCIAEFIQQLEAEGNLVLVNPPPFGPYRCPNCFSILSEK